MYLKIKLQGSDHTFLEFNSIESVTENTMSDNTSQCRIRTKSGDILILPHSIEDLPQELKVVLGVVDNAS